jgi:hypothetical protein
MVQFRKSKKFGPVRITASKKGLGVSAGAGPVRVGLGADGKVRRTLRLPGTGIYDTKVVAAADKTARPQTPVTSKPEVRLEQPPIAPRRLQPVALTKPITAKGHNGTVTFDGWWIGIERSGTLARLAATVNSYESKRIPLDQVEHVEWKQPSTFVNGYLRVVVTGEEQPARRVTAAAADANTVVVTKQQAARFTPLRAALAQALAAGEPNACPPAEATAAHKTYDADPAVSAAASPPPAPPANWYPDPADPAMLRWWNGSSWTDHTAPHP